MLTQALKYFKKLDFNGLLLTKLYNVRAKESIEELRLITLKIDVKFEGKLTCAFENNMKNLVNFHLQTKK